MYSSSIQTSIVKSKHKRSLITRLKSQWQLQIIALLALIWMLIFNYGPIGGLVIAFKNYSITSTIIDAPWVGLDHFIDFFTDEKFVQVLRNTLGISILKLTISTPCAILFAVLLNEMPGLHFKKISQTISYLPHFISWVIIGGLLTTWCSESGFANELLIKMSILESPVNFLAEPKYFWGIAIGTDLWKELGWNSILYYAAVVGVDATLHEAASVDGAGRIRRIWHVTLPSIKGTIVTLLILNVGHMLDSNFNQILVLSNSLNQSASDVIDVYSYRMGMQSGRFSYAAAVGLSKSVVALILLLGTNAISKRLTDSSLF